MNFDESMDRYYADPPGTTPSIIDWTLPSIPSLEYDCYKQRYGAECHQMVTTTKMYQCSFAYFQMWVRWVVSPLPLFFEAQKYRSSGRRQWDKRSERKQSRQDDFDFDWTDSAVLGNCWCHHSDLYWQTLTWCCAWFFERESRDCWMLFCSMWNRSRSRHAKNGNKFAPCVRSKLLFYGFLTRNASLEFDAGMRDRGLLNNPCWGLLTEAVVETLDIWFVEFVVELFV